MRARAFINDGGVKIFLPFTFLESLSCNLIRRCSARDGRNAVRDSPGVYLSMCKKKTVTKCRLFGLREASADFMLIFVWAEFVWVLHYICSIQRHRHQPGYPDCWRRSIRVRRTARRADGCCCSTPTPALAAARATAVWSTGWISVATVDSCPRRPVCSAKNK